MPRQDSFSLRWKRALLIALGWLPLPLLHAIGWLAGVVLWRLPNKLRRTTLRHLELCLPELNDKARARVARRSLIESMKAVAEAPAIWFGPMRRLRRWMDDADALRELRAAAAAPEGLILLTPHLGSWELAGQFAAHVGPISILYKPQRGDWETIIREGRARQPTVQLATTDASGVKLLLAALGRGEMVGLLPDHDPPEGSGRFAPFFGIPAHTMDLVGKLAARTGAAVWFIVAERRPHSRGFRIQLSRAPLNVTDAEEGPAALNRGVEACVMLRPEQYWWSYRRFRRRPPGATDLYRYLR